MWCWGFWRLSSYWKVSVNLSSMGRFPPSCISAFPCAWLHGNHALSIVFSWLQAELHLPVNFHGIAIDHHISQLWTSKQTGNTGPASDRVPQVRAACLLTRRTTVHESLAWGMLVPIAHLLPSLGIAGNAYFFCRGMGYGSNSKF